MPDKLTGENYEEHIDGTPSYGFNIWLDAVDRDIKDLQKTVTSLKGRAVQVMVENVQLRQKLKSSVIEKGEMTMMERDEALEANPYN